MRKVLTGFREDGRAIVRTIDNRRKFTGEIEVGWLQIRAGMLSFTTSDEALINPGELAQPRRSEVPIKMETPTVKVEVTEVSGVDPGQVEVVSGEPAPVEPIVHKARRSG